MAELFIEWWWSLLPILGWFGSDSVNPAFPFSDEFATSRSGQTIRNTVPGPGEQEKRVLDSLEGLSKEQKDAISYVINQAKAPISFQSLGLSSDDANVLDQAYAGAEADMRRSAGLLGQDLSTTRGLNRSDTPVAEVVMREFLPAIQQLYGQKAQNRLGLGLNMRQLGEGARQFNLSAALSGGQSVPASGLALAGNLERTRMARSGQNISGWNQGSPVDTGLKMSEMYKNVMGGSSGFIGASDERLKEHIRPVSWRWKSGNGPEQLGVVAQEVQKTHPHLVLENQDGDLMVDYGALAAMLLDERRHLYEELSRYKEQA